MNQWTFENMPDKHWQYELWNNKVSVTNLQAFQNLDWFQFNILGLLNVILKKTWIWLLKQFSMRKGSQVEYQFKNYIVSVQNRKK